MTEQATHDGRIILFQLHAGSHAYGTDTPESDVDVRGVVMPKVEEIIGLQRFEMLEQRHGEDVVFYSLHKFVNLLLKGNPNVHEWLWAPNINVTHKWGALLVNNASQFLSAAVGKQSLGYLNGQTKRMHHLAPTRDLGAKRKELVEKFGYDTKNAAHAVRIARQTATLFNTGELVVRRPDREELLVIRSGKLTFDTAMRIVVDETIKCEKAVEANKAGIPDKVPFKFADYLVQDITQRYLKDEWR